MRKLLPLVLIGLLPLAGALGAAPLADRLPADCIAYVGWAGRTESFDNTHFGQMVKTPAFAQMIKAIQGGIKDSTTAGKNQIAQEHLWKLLEIAWTKPLAVSLMGMEKTRKGGKPQLAAVMDLGDDRAAFEVHLRSLLKIAEAPLSDGQAGDLDYQILSAPPGLIGFGYIGNLFFVTVGKDVPARLVAVKAANSLATNKKFTGAVAEVDGPGLQVVDYADMQAMIAILDTLQPPRHAPMGGPEQGDGPNRSAEPTPRDLLEAMGMTKATTSASGVRAIGTEMFSRTRLSLPAPRSGVLTALLGKPLTDADLATIPADSLVAVAANWSADRAWTEILTLIRKFAKDEVPDDAQIKKMMQESLGIRIDEDLLAHLGDTWTLVSSPSLGGVATGTFLCTEVRNPEALAASIEKVKAHLTPAPRPDAPDEEHYGYRRPQPSVQQFTSGDATIYYLAASGTRAPVSMAWAVHRNRFYLALYPQVISAALKPPRSDPLTASPALLRMRKLLHPNPSMIGYANLPDLATQVYPLCLLGWSAVCNSTDELGVKLQPQWLPDLPTVQEYLSPVLVAVSHDAGGISFESCGPIPVPISGFQGTSMIVMSLVAPSVSGAMDNARRYGSLMNLRMIAGSAREFQRSEGKFPESFPAMIDAGYIPSAVLRSPANPAAPPVMRNGKIEGKSDYVYLYYPKAADTPAESLLAYEDPTNWNNEGTCVATVSGGAKFVTIEAFRKLRASATLLQARQMRDAAKP